MVGERDTIFGVTPVLLSSKFKHFDCVRLLATKALQLRDAALAAEANAKKGKKTCCSCGITFGVVIQNCYGCFRKRYCSTACQAAGWDEHKAECMMWRREIRDAERKEAERAEAVERAKEAEKEKEKEAEEEAERVEVERKAEEEEIEVSDESKPCSHYRNRYARVEKFACDACGESQYCGKLCQKAHWKSGHKEDCKEWRKREEEGKG